jgi:hypothetical protein
MLARSRQEGNVAQLDSDKCQGLVGTLGMKVMNQGDMWKPWMILGAKFHSWANCPWFFPKNDSLF